MNQRVTCNKETYCHIMLLPWKGSVHHVSTLHTTSCLSGIMSLQWCKTQTHVTLSKQTQSMEPDTLITLELMHDIWCFLSLLRAYSFPIVMVAGRAGGITIVMMSRAFNTISPGLSPRLNWNKSSLYSFLITLNFISLIYTNYKYY